MDDRIGAVQTDGPLGEGVGDGFELGGKAFPGKRQPGPHRPAGLDPLAGTVAGDLGDPLDQLPTAAAALPGGQPTLAQLVAGLLRDFPGGEHPEGVDAPAGPLGRRQHPQQVILGKADQLARVQQVGDLLGDRIQPAAGGDGGGVVHTHNCPTHHRHYS
ncbi:MAG TPA: hypothetical protein VLZ78_07440 [Terrimesophilobacter sp.]|nr:hypothetical protein [Terrimesophilobacter sp.]